jgi:hypothetical protein
MLKKIIDRQVFSDIIWSQGRYNTVAEKIRHGKYMEKRMTIYLVVRPIDYISADVRVAFSWQDA